MIQCHEEHVYLSSAPFSGQDRTRDPKIKGQKAAKRAKNLQKPKIDCTAMTPLLSHNKCSLVSVVVVLSLLYLQRRLLRE
jgi:hypothetical protein